MEKEVYAPREDPAPITLKLAFILLSVGLLFASSLYNYLLFHIVAETLGIIVAVCVFMLAWNTRKFMQHNYLLFLGIASMFIAIIAFVHMLAYKGMPIFPGYTSNLPTQLWIAERYMQAISLLIAPIFFRRNLNIRAALVSFSVITFTILALAFSGNLPAAYVEGSGLTQFKIISEYVISALFGISIYLLYRNRKRFDESIYRLMTFSIIAMVVSELLFTFYISVYGITNFFGHVFNIFAFSFLYMAIIQTGLSKPYTFLFKELNDSNRLKDLFIDIMRHDILNPVGAIRLRAEMALKYDRFNNHRDNYEKIMQSSDLVIHMIDNAHKLASMQGKERLETKEIDIRQIIGSAIASLNHEAVEKGQKITIQGQKKAIVEGNPLLYDVFYNLLSNAIKYGPRDGTIHVRIAHAGNLIRVTVSDQGRGIPDDQKEAIFQRFNRLEKGDIKGSGLGLAIVRSVANAHSGRVWVKDNPGGGSIFTVEIPIRPPSKQNQEKKHHKQIGGNGKRTATGI